LKHPNYSLGQNPTLEEAFQIIRDGFKQKKTVLIVGNCSVSYLGRASSKLESGDRIAIFKPDGSVLVHRPRDYAPVNWQPPGSLFNTRIRGNTLQVRAFRKRENEVLEIIFDNVILVSALELKDAGEFYLHASEKDMQRAIMLEPSLLEEGFRPISAERAVESGFIDIFGRDKNNILTIVEIKRNPATREDVLQLRKYVENIQNREEPNIRGIIVAPQLARGSQTLLATLGLEFKPLSPEKCSAILRSHDNKRLTDFFGEDRSIDRY